MLDSRLRGNDMLAWQASDTILSQLRGKTVVSERLKVESAVSFPRKRESRKPPRSKGNAVLDSRLEACEEIGVGLRL